MAKERIPQWVAATLNDDVQTTVQVFLASITAVQPLPKTPQVSVVRSDGVWYRVSRPADEIRLAVEEARRSG